MFPANFPFRRFTLLILATLLAGPVACSRSVSRLEMDTAQERVDAATTRLAKVDQEYTDLQKEFKERKDFGGPEHQKKLQAAVALRAEKAELEGLKKDLDNRLEHFEKEAARHREELAKMKSH